MRMSARALLAQSMRDVVRVTALLFKNDAAWIDSGLSLRLVSTANSGVSFPFFAAAGSNVSAVDDVPDGTYVIYAKTTPNATTLGPTRTYFGTITVSGENVTIPLHYYSVTLTAGVGIIQSNLVGGVAWIVKGGLRNIRATNAVKEGYQWANWTNTDDGTVFSTAQTGLSLSGISREYRLTANAVPVS